MQTLPELLKAAKLKTKEQVAKFHELRQEAFAMAAKVYADRSISYNVDHEPFEEMVYGPVSLASEIHKRATRLAGLLTPERTEPYRPEDINRMLDLNIDIINYCSWQYALLKQAGANGNHMGDDAPKYIDTTDLPSIERSEG